VQEHAKAAHLHHDVTVLHCAGEDPNLAGSRWWRMEQESEPALTEFVPTYRVWHRRRPFPGTTTPLHCWSALQAAERLVRLVGRPDVIHAHVYEAGMPAMTLARRLCAPMIVTEHSSDLSRRQVSALQLLKARRVFESSDAVVPVSDHLRQSIESFATQAILKTIPNTVDPTQFFPASRSERPGDPVRLLFVGSLIPVKGLAHLLNALSSLGDARPRWSLDVVGDGELRTQYEQQAIQLGLGDRTTFRGRQSKHQVAEFMRGSDLLILPSLFETAGCVLIEAMSCGLPIVASRVGGVPQIVHKTVGRLCAPGDPEQLARTVASTIRDIESFDQDAILKRAHRYQLTVVGSELDLLYRGVVA